MNTNTRYKGAQYIEGRDREIFNLFYHLCFFLGITQGLVKAVTLFNLAGAVAGMA